MGDKAFKLGNDSPNDPVERFVFIEGYAHMGDWQRAVELSRASYRVSKDYLGPLLCRLWERIEAESTGGPESDVLTGEAVSERSEALVEIQNMIACDP